MIDNARHHELLDSSAFLVALEILFDKEREIGNVILKRSGQQIHRMKIAG